MPAISADPITLPRIPDPGPAAVDRPVVSVTTAPSALEGEGFPRAPRLRRRRPGHPGPPRAHGPDGRGRLRPGEPKGTPWHPHRVFETVTYMIDGIFQHQDSNGGGGLITDGDTRWMTARAVGGVRTPV
jgi:hypothetical protein